jgi:hypothetical protein
MIRQTASNPDERKVGNPPIRLRAFGRSTLHAGCMLLSQSQWSDVRNTPKSDGSERLALVQLTTPPSCGESPSAGCCFFFFFGNQLSAVAENSGWTSSNCAAAHPLENSLENL